MKEETTKGTKDGIWMKVKTVFFITFLAPLLIVAFGTSAYFMLSNSLRNIVPDFDIPFEYYLAGWGLWALVGIIGTLYTWIKDKK